MSAPEVNMEDLPPLLRFEQTTKENRAKTLQEGKVVYDNMTLVHVRAHGDTKNEVPYEVESWIAQLAERLHKNLISQDYHDFCVKSFKAYEAKAELPIDGTPIKTWSLITEAQKQHVLDANIMTVERLADASEDALGAIGMGARDLKKKATNWLESNNDAGKSALRITTLEAEKEASEERMSELEKKLAELTAQAEQKPKRGRPKTM